MQANKLLYFWINKMDLKIMLAAGIIFIQTLLVNVKVVKWHLQYTV